MARNALCSRRCTISIWCGTNFPRRCCWPASRSLGRDCRCADAGQPAQGAADVRGVRRAGRSLRGRRRQSNVILYDILIAPFADFEFMRRALVGTLALAFGAAPIGVFLMLRRMSLIGDAMAHAILPGAAVGFLLSGLNLFAMAAAGLSPVSSWLWRRPGRALDRTQGGRLAGRLLYDFAGARRHHRVGRAPISICCTFCSAPCWRSTIQTLMLIAATRR